MTLAWKYCFTGWLDKGADTPEEIWKNHEGKLNYLCGQIEETKEEKKHVQFWVEFKKRLRPAGVMKIFPSASYHHERCGGTDEELNKYNTKDDTRVPGTTSWTFGETLHSRNTVQKEIVEVEAKVKDGCSEHELWDEHFALMTTRQMGIRRGMEILQAEVVEPKFALSDFTWTPITEWKTTHLFYGDADIGKTSFAIAHFKHPFFCTELDNLKNFSKSLHDGIVFDDLTESFGDLSDDVVIHLLDVDHPRQIKCRYFNATIPSGTRKIITTVKDPSYVFGELPAIARRITIHRLCGQQRGTAAEPIPPAGADAKQDLLPNRVRERDDGRDTSVPQLTVPPHGEEEWTPMSTMNPAKRKKFRDMATWERPMMHDDDDEEVEGWTDTEDDEPDMI